MWCEDACGSLMWNWRGMTWKSIGEVLDGGMRRLWHEDGGWSLWFLS